MTEKESLESEGFVIKDKRSSQISEDDATNIDTIEEQKNSSNEKEAASSQVDFPTFIMSLSSSAFYHLGDMPDPTTGKKELNLPAVQQTIDMLNMLKEKTKDNLKEDESKLLEQLIYELQVKYVAKSKA
jgi:protein-tyrosine-phosphatase